MFGLLLTVVLGASVLVGESLARRFRVAAPILLLVIGGLLGLVPGFTAVELPSDVVLLLFLPALLYSEAILTSLRELRRYLRGIVLQATVLVALTAGTVAVVGHLFGLPWAPAWVLGAALAPTDATAVSAFAKALPRQQITILRAESLLNDGMALTIYALAIAVVVQQSSVTVLDVSWRVLLAYGGGAAAGLLVAWIGVQTRKRLTDQLLLNLLALLTPFVAYLLAESIEASGVLATVTAGLLIGRSNPRVARASTRLQGLAFWDLATFVLNGTLFVLVGLELHTAVSGLSVRELVFGSGAVLVVSVVLVAVRTGFLFASAYLIRALDRSERQHARRLPNSTRVVRGFAGFRGAVSLAAALGVPATVASGAAFPGRDLIVFVTAGVIVVTLVGQGLLLPVLVRRARFPSEPDTAPSRRAAELEATEQALTHLDEVAASIGASDQTTVVVRERYQQTVDRLRRGLDDDTAEEERQVRQLLLALLDRKRSAILDLRDTRRIDDEDLHDLQRRLDIEELRLTARS